MKQNWMCDQSKIRKLLTPSHQQADVSKKVGLHHAQCFVFTFPTWEGKHYSPGYPLFLLHLSAFIAECDAI